MDVICVKVKWFLFCLLLIWALWDLSLIFYHKYRLQADDIQVKMGINTN